MGPGKVSGMMKRAIYRILPGMLVLMFVAGAFGAAAAASPEGDASGRASDSEPNGDLNSAARIADGEVVIGSLLTTSGNDQEDWYKIDVPYGKVLNASMFMVDYNTTDHGKINFQLDLILDWQTTYDSSTTMERWESVMTLQHWNRGPFTIGIRVSVNRTWGGGGWQVHSDRGQYAVSASITDPIVHAGPSTSAYCEKGAGPRGGAIYILNPGPADNKLMRAKLQNPVTGANGLQAYFVWAVSGSRYRLNASWSDATGYTQDIQFGGYNGTYYLEVRGISGNGTYTLTTSDVGWVSDGGVPASAQLVNDLSPHSGWVDQGVDWADWYKVMAKANRPITQAYLILDAGNYLSGSQFSFSVYDQGLAQIGTTNTIPYQTGTPPHTVTNIQVNNITVNYDGPVYFVVRAGNFQGNMGANFVGSKGWYILTFVLPNDAPRLTGTPAEIHMQEDTTDESLVLSGYVMDPDNDTLSYKLFGSGYKFAIKVNSTTGKVSLTPWANWSGTDKVRFLAVDNGAGNKSVELNVTVVVEPVNDQPTVAGALNNMVLLEEVMGQTADVSEMFKDIDDSSENLTYSLKVIGRDTHPAGANLTTFYDAKTHSFKLGPASGFFGSFMLEVSCTDNHPGTVPVSVVFNLTINHRNHDPQLADGVVNPTVVTMNEHDTNSAYVISSFFTDIDMGKGYANDSLKFTMTGAHRLDANLSADGRITIGTGTEQYYPGQPYEESLVLTARDQAGRSVSMNLTVKVIPVNDPPEITGVIPDKQTWTMPEGKKDIFRITAGDPDTPELGYTWYFDGDRQKETGPVFTYQPDYNSAGPHSLKVVLSDGDTNLTVEWNITVTDLNRLPTAQITSPINSTKFVKGTRIPFSATGSDPDGDIITYIWRDDTGMELGRAQNLTVTSLQSGTRIVTLEANDGKGSVLQQVTISITNPPGNKGGGGFIPGFELLAVALALCICIGAASLRRSRPGS